MKRLLLLALLAGAAFLAWRGYGGWRAESDRHRDYLVNHITEPTQRAAFLALAEIRAPTARP